MKYQEFLPDPLFRNYIHCFWRLENKQKIVKLQPQRILPDGCMELIFHYGEKNSRLNGKGQAELEPRSLVSGQIKRHIQIQNNGQVGVFGVRFRPHGLYSFFRQPLRELAEQVIDLKFIFGKDGRIIESKMIEAKTNWERISLIQKFLLKQLNPIHWQDSFFHSALKLIKNSGGLISIDDLSLKVGLSGRQLERKFNEVIGLTPKLYSRIIRFQRLFPLIKQHPGSSLTWLANESGYFDQAHFIRDFKEFSGLTPSDYFSQNPQLSAFFTADVKMSDFYNSN